jgi:hypothetical protein
MKRLLAIIEDAEGRVIGASTSEGDIMLAKAQQFPRSELAERAPALASHYGVEIPPEYLAIVGQG